VEEGRKMVKCRIKNFNLFILLLSVVLLDGQYIHAAEVDLNIDGGNGYIEVDDSGGYQASNELHWNGFSHTATTSLAIYDAISGDIDNVQVDDYMGDPNDDRQDTWSNNQSGIWRYAAPVAGMPACIADVGAAPGGDPSVPVSFMGSSTGLTVEQFVYGGANDPFAIYVYRIINNTGNTKNIKVAHFNDFDVVDGSSDDDKGYDEINRLVWQWDDDNGGYIAGTALLDRPVSNWFLEYCCTMTWSDGGYAAQMGFFTDDPAFNGAKPFTPGEDLEVDIATNVGILQPGRAAIVVFVVAAAQGGTSATALTNLQATIATARNCYNSIGGADEDDDDPIDYGEGPVKYGNNNDGFDWPCFIATAGYGSHMEPHVMTLRHFRDSYLLTNRLGTKFVNAYYEHSPPIADFIARHDSLKALVKIGLAPLASFSWIALNYGMMAALAVLFSLLSLFAGMTFMILKNKQD